MFLGIFRSDLQKIVKKGSKFGPPGPKYGHFWPFFGHFRSFSDLKIFLQVRGLQNASDFFNQYNYFQRHSNYNLFIYYSILPLGQAPPKRIWTICLLFDYYFFSQNCVIFKGGLQNASPVFLIFFKTLKSTENVFILFDKVAKLSLCQYAIWHFFPISSILKI